MTIIINAFSYVTPPASLKHEIKIDKSTQSTESEEASLEVSRVLLLLVLMLLRKAPPPPFLCILLPLLYQRLL